MIRHHDRGAGRTKGSNLGPVCAATSSSVYPAARPEACLTGTLVAIGMRTGTEGPLTLRWREADELAGRTAGEAAGWALAETGRINILCFLLRLRTCRKPHKLHSGKHIKSFVKSSRT
jgi:hypothetical protein